MAGWADAYPDQDKKGTSRSMSAEWYVLQTKPRKEDFVVGQLSGRRAEIFFPRLVESVRTGEGRQQRLSPMFPSYLFVKIDVDENGKGRPLYTWSERLLALRW